MKHAIEHVIIKPFDLLNTIPLTSTKKLASNLLMWTVHKLRIFSK